jgi:hypothetical protein
MPNEIIIERFRILIPEYREYLLSAAPSLIASTFSEPHNLSPEKTISLENGFAMYLLFFINFDGLVNYILEECDLTINEATLLAHGMNNALPEEARRLLINTSNDIFDSIEKGGLNLISEISEIENSLQTVRTMSSDSAMPVPQPEATYSSVQSAILNERK